MFTRNFLAAGLCLALTTACGDDDATELAALGVPPGLTSGNISLLRLADGGGEPSLYRPDSLTRLSWNGPDRMPAISRPLGFDPDDEMVYGVGKDGAIIGLDMLARRYRSMLGRSSLQSGTPDGMVLAIDTAGRLVRFDNRAGTDYRGAVEPGAVQLVRGTGGRINAYNPAAGLLQVMGEDGELRRYQVPSGQLSSSWFGDILIIATDSGLSTVRPAVDSVPTFTRIRGNPIVAVPSPSAHRLYLARGRGDLLLLDRFSLDEIASIDLPGVARELRPDRSGRWILARAETGDTAWVVDLVARRVMATFATRWDADLPLIVAGTTLLGRSGADVVAWDITNAELRPNGRITDGADDIYLLIDWRPAGERPAAPPPPPRELASEQPEAADQPAPDDRPSGAEEPAQADQGATGGEIYIQVTASQNEGYARALAGQLSDIGFRARVRDPVGDGAGYRVLVGPYPSRDEAEADGRRLGRPYFITAPQSRQQ